MSSEDFPATRISFLVIKQLSGEGSAAGQTSSAAIRYASRGAVGTTGIRIQRAMIPLQGVMEEEGGGTMEEKLQDFSETCGLKRLPVSAADAGTGALHHPAA